jgi:hypothetical protein
MATLITEENRNKPHKQPMRVTWETKVFRKDGTLKERKSGENSLVAGFAFFVYIFLNTTPADTEHDITNTLRVGYQLYPLAAVANGLLVGNNYTAGNTTTFGIVVGTNNTAVTADDYKLNTIVAAGVAASQLYHYSCTCNDVVTDATTANMRIDRVFANNSGGTITIKELGIYGYNGAPYTFCLCRDIIADPGTDIDNGEYMQVQYTITVTEA